MFNIFLIVFIFMVYLLSKILIKDKNISNKVFLSIVFFTLFLFVGFRSTNTGNDTYTYIELFKKCTKSTFNTLSQLRYEKGYLFFNYIIGKIIKNPRIFMLIMSFIFNFIVYWFIKKYSKNYLISVLVYVGLLFLYLSMTMYRQFFAIVIILISYRFAINKKILPFLVCLFLAYSMHTSAIASIIIYPICNLEYTRKRSFLIIIFAFISMIFLNLILSKFTLLFNYEVLYEIRNGSFSLANLLYFITFFILFIIGLIINKTNQNADNNKYLYFLLISAAFNFIAIRMNVLSRITDYFGIFSIIAIPNLFYNLKTYIFNKRIILILLFIFLVTYSTTIIVLRPEWNSAFNYKFCVQDKTCIISY